MSKYLVISKHTHMSHHAATTGTTDEKKADSANWLASNRDAIECAYAMVGGGSVAIVEAEDNNALAALIASFEHYGLVDFEISPLYTH